MVSATRRTAGCGPACPVVWQGRVGDHSPYADYPIRSLFGGDVASGVTARMSTVDAALRVLTPRMALAMMGTRVFARSLSSNRSGGQRCRVRWCNWQRDGEQSCEARQKQCARCFPHCEYLDPLTYDDGIEPQSVRNVAQEFGDAPEFGS